MTRVRITCCMLAALGVACGAPATVAHTTSPAPAPLTADKAQRLDATAGLQRNDAIAAALGDIDQARIRRIDSVLVSFGTRNSFSDTMSSTHGIGAARRWIFGEFQQYARECGGCLRVEYNSKVQSVARAQGREVNIVDVLAWLPGRDTSRVVVISGHYDSCVCGMPGGGNDSLAIAPGADDDGSGTSAVVELARVFSKRYPKGLDASIIFATVAAEEQGLLGARQLAEWLHEHHYRVVAGMTDDIVGNVLAEGGYADSTTMRIFAADPDNSPSRELGRYVWSLDRLYMPSFEVLPVWRLDRIGRGGDHEPYVTLGDAGLRFTERVENYNRQHLPTDDFAHVNFGYVANVARVNAITVAALASAPATPANARAVRQGRAAASVEANAARTGSGGQAWTLSWDASTGAVGYELLVRRTTSPTWDQVIPLGNVTRCTLARQLDDEWAGVRAVAADGSRSMAASMPAPPEAVRESGAAATRAPTGGRGAQPAGPPPPACGAGR
ncbi:MAG TPA: M28 family peptidase [Gemmatimonadaceae bacterium]|nr:M28 family peptidase [Gemmatimonadaceae bacterium]